MQASVPPLDPTALLGRFSEAARAAGFRSEPFGEVGGYPLLALTKRTAGPRPRIYVSAGIHGDEPASSLALLDLLEAGVFDGRAVWFLCPLLNPLALLRRKRENPDGVDLNRDYHLVRSAEARAHIAWLRRQPNFDYSLCLHEDWEAKGFYLYERSHAPYPAETAAALAAAGQFLPIDANPTIDGFEARDGVIRPSFDPASWELWPESVYINLEHHTQLHYTFESPSTFALGLRIAALRAATEAVLAKVGRDASPRRP